jgi:cob(I)alamin adenosyltransferase
MILIYTGEGKGKTSAAVGQIVRGLGQGMRVAAAQFMKRPDQAGEQKFLGEVLGEFFLAGGMGFLRNQAEFETHRKAALGVLDRVNGWLAEEPPLEILVLDESLYALDAGLLTREELEAMIQTVQARNVHLVLTGRGLPDWLRERADLVTEMVERKHPYHTGVKAARGIEY